jgi:hypothetical protein
MLGGAIARIEVGSFTTGLDLFLGGFAQLRFQIGDLYSGLQNHPAALIGRDRCGQVFGPEHGQLDPMIAGPEGGPSSDMQRLED